MEECGIFVARAEEAGIQANRLLVSEARPALYWLRGGAAPAWYRLSAVSEPECEDAMLRTFPGSLGPAIMLSPRTHLRPLVTVFVHLIWVCHSTNGFKGQQRHLEN